MVRKSALLGAALASTAFMFAANAALADTCVGNCGTATASNGVVTLPPDGANSYQWISTYGGVGGAGELPGIGGSDGSSLTSSIFAATVGQQLNFNFNFITSDGAGYSDYAFAQLRTASGAVVATLFTARTEPSGNISPGKGLPANSSTLTPGTSGIHGGAPSWAALGGSSGACYDRGCGYTGWINAKYTIASAGSYQIVFGVSNVLDGAFDTGLAFSSVTVGGTPVVDGVAGIPETSTWMMMFAGFAGLGLVGQSRRKVLVFAA
jgi:hypothetical protein